ncbi:MAG TPA: hypothetical protein VF516_15815, partial [Kofleriaceae bacterium]
MTWAHDVAPFTATSGIPALAAGQEIPCGAGCDAGRAAVAAEPGGGVSACQRNLWRGAGLAGDDGSVGH